MAVPKFRDFILPVLLYFADEKIHTIKECMDEVIQRFDLNEEDLRLLIPTGTQTVVSNRVYWSLTYLKKSLLLNVVEKGKYKITIRGKELLATNPIKIDRKLLMQYPEFVDFIKGKNKSIEKENESVLEEEITPDDEIAEIYNKINDKLADDLLELILDKSSYAFEYLVIDLLTKMGYGEEEENRKYLTPKTKDGGIDGIINQDRLGLEKVYVQAKRWNGSVGRPELQHFVGALSGRKANRGVFVTTSYFSSQALEFMKESSYNIILIDGKTLVKYMIEYNVGVQTIHSYEIKRIDTDYFKNSID